MSLDGQAKNSSKPRMGACLPEEAVNLRGTEEDPSLPAARNGNSSPKATVYPLLEKMLERDNMIVANGGDTEVDGVDVKNLKSRLADH